MKKSDIQRNIEHMYAEIDKKAEDRATAEEFTRIKFELERLGDRIARVEKLLEVAAVTVVR